MDAVDAAQTLRHPDAVLAIGRVLSVLVGDDGPQRHELKPMPRDRLGIKLVDVAHVVAVALAARDRVAEPQHPQPGGGELVENPVDSRGVLGAPLLAAEAQRRAALAHVDAVVGPEHHDGDIGLLARREGLDRGQPLLLVMHQRGAGMGAVEHAKARVLGQHALQAAREAGRLAVAEYDDSRRALLVLRRGLRLALCLAVSGPGHARAAKKTRRARQATRRARLRARRRKPESTAARRRSPVPRTPKPQPDSRLSSRRLQPGRGDAARSFTLEPRQLLTACRGVRRPLQAEAGERGREGGMSARSTGRTRDGARG